MGFAIFKTAAFRYTSAGFAVAVITYAGIHIGVPIAKEFNDSFAMKEFKAYGIFGTYQRHFFSFKVKFRDLENLENENEALRGQLAALDKKQTIDEATRAERELASMNEVLEQKAAQQGGSPAAHLPQAIPYHVPEHFNSTQLYSLALVYFRKQDYEKSSVLLNHLLTLDEEAKYKTAENFLLSGISWFHLKNYILARKQISECVRKSPARTEVHRQALLWDALVEKTIGNPNIAQTKLLFFVGQYPHSIETAWVNGSRSPAREGHEVSSHTLDHAVITQPEEKPLPAEKEKGEPAHEAKQEKSHDVE